MSPQDRRLAKGEWVLVTGANGYIATHIVDVLLEEGYNVRGTLRSAKPWLNKYFDEKYGPGRFETKTVEALNDEGAFDEVIKGVGGVVHVVCKYASWLRRPPINRPLFPPLNRH
jgi:nucleoside-diphosphate-sugar epimerase